MPFTEMCCRAGGSNLNAGTRKGDSTEPGTTATFTYAAGDWVASTGVFTVASGDPVADGVEVGDFASVFATGSTVTGFVGRVTARTSTTITVSLTAKSGTAPTDGTGNRELRIGGAWAGPNGSVGWPLNSDLFALTNESNHPCRVNLKNDQNYDITAGITVSSNGKRVFKGYSTSYDDSGKSTIRGPATGASFTLITASAIFVD
jgi:hypothetical protein